MKSCSIPSSKISERAQNLGWILGKMCSVPIFPVAIQASKSSLNEEDLNSLVQEEYWNNVHLPKESTLITPSGRIRRESLILHRPESISNLFLLKLPRVENNDCFFHFHAESSWRRKAAPPIGDTLDKICLKLSGHGILIDVLRQSGNELEARYCTRCFVHEKKRVEELYYF